MSARAPAFKLILIIPPPSGIALNLVDIVELHPTQHVY